MKSYLTQEQKQQLIEAIKSTRIAYPNETIVQTFRLALGSVNFQDKLKISNSSATAWFAKAFPKPAQEFTDGDSDKSPEQIIAECERIIQEQLKLLDHRRNLKMQEIEHLDNLIHKYKVPRN